MRALSFSGVKSKRRVDIIVENWRSGKLWRISEMAMVNEHHDNSKMRRRVCICWRIEHHYAGNFFYGAQILPSIRCHKPWVPSIQKTELQTCLRWMALEALHENVLWREIKDFIWERGELSWVWMMVVSSSKNYIIKTAPDTIPGVSWVISSTTHHPGVFKFLELA